MDVSCTVSCTAIAHATRDGRNGHVHSQDGEPELDVHAPNATRGNVDVTLSIV
jgi:organic hydroperoxide reductase OsmC/OhrA